MTKSQTKGKKNPIYKITKNIAMDKAKIIDSLIIPFIPKWQLKLIKSGKFKITNKIFGYTLDVEHNFDLDTYTLKRYGKVLNKFIIKTKVNYEK